MKQSHINLLLLSGVLFTGVLNASGLDQDASEGLPAAPSHLAAVASGFPPAESVSGQPESSQGDAPLARLPSAIGGLAGAPSSSACAGYAYDTWADAGPQSASPADDAGGPTSSTPVQTSGSGDAEEEDEEDKDEGGETLAVPGEDASEAQPGEATGEGKGLNSLD